MASQSACSSFLSSDRRFFPQRFISTPGVISRRDLTFQSVCTQKAFATSLKWTKDLPHFRLNKGVIVGSVNSDSVASVGGRDEIEQIQGKPETGSFFWTAGPLALVMSLAISPMNVGTLFDLMTKEKLTAEFFACLSSEAALYAGLATFLIIMDRAQSPYLRFSAKRLSLVAGLRGYMTWSCCMKFALSSVAIYFTFPHLGMKGLVAVTPFIASCVAQILLEISLKLRGSSSWPLVPIILEAYRVYRLNHSVLSLLEQFVGRDGIKGRPQMIALGGMFMTSQVLGVICLWSLLKFLFRLFPSRHAGDNQ